MNNEKVLPVLAEKLKERQQHILEVKNGALQKEVFMNICEEVFSKSEDRYSVENLRKIINYQLEGRIEVEDLLKLLIAEVDSRIGLGDSEGSEFDLKHGTQTNEVVMQFELPELISLDRYEESTEYVPTPVESMNKAFEALAKLDVKYEDHIFMDIGCGMGRNLLLASEFPFRKIIGIDIAEHLIEIARSNIKKYKTPTQQCTDIEAHCVDAMKYEFIKEDMVLYFWQPFGDPISNVFIQNLLDFVEKNGVNVTLVFLQRVFPAVTESKRFRRLMTVETGSHLVKLDLSIFKAISLSHQKACTYWQKKLNVARENRFAEVFKPGHAADRSRRYAEFSVPTKTGERLLQLSKGKEFNIYKLGLAALNMLFGKYTRQSKIYITSPAIKMSGQHYQRSSMILEEIAYSAQMTPREMLKKIHAELEYCIAYQKYNYWEFASEYIYNTNLGRSFFNIGFGYEPVNEKHADLEKMGISFWLSKAGDEFRLAVSSHNTAYDNTFIDTVARHFFACIDRVCQSLDESVAHFELLDTQAHRLLESYFDRNEQAVQSEAHSAIAGKVYPVSPAQNRMFVVQKMDEKAITYNIPFHTSLDKAYSLEAIKSAFTQLATRHESLRTAFEMQAEGPVQIVHDAIDFDIELFDQVDLEEAMNQFVRPFDLSKAPLFRLGYHRSEDSEAFLMVDLHHIITDEMSQKILGNELMALLNKEELPPVGLQYKDYVAWLNTDDQQQALKKQEAYWDEVFADELAMADLPTDFPRPDFQTDQGAYAGFTTSEAEFKILNRLVSEHGVSMFTLLLSVWTILLAKLTDEEDVVVGTAVAGRKHSDLERIVGMFVNMLPMRNRVGQELLFTDFLMKVKENFINAFDNQEHPFESIVEKHWDSTIAGRHPIFDTIFGLFKRDDLELIDQDNDTAINFGTKEVVAKFDLALAAIDYGDSLRFTFTYNKQLFKAETVGKLIAHFRMIIAALEQEAPLTLGQIEVIAKEEKALLAHFNNTAYAYPDTSIVEQFEKQVAATPDQIALTFEGQQWSYQALNEKANVMARTLIDHYSIQVGDRVGVMMERSNWSIIAVLGILKSGAAYVPIQLNYPDERKRFIIKDTQIKTLIIQSESLMDILDLEVSAFSIDVQLEEAENEESRKNITPSIADAESLAYIMYTSGSTGTPKGVLIKHQSIARLIFNAEFEFLNSDTVLYHYAPLAFDASTFELWGALLKGGRLVVSGSGQKTLEAIEEELKKEQVNTLWLTAGLFHMAVDNCISLFSELDYILAGGDTIYPDRVKVLLEQYEQLTFINGYGPTESTTFAIVNKIANSEGVNLNQNIIGRPISNTQIYILDRSFSKLMPINMVGEICIGGDGLAKGYLNRPELTDERFIEHPFQTGQKLYKTGDLGRWLPDGTIAFIGRRDNQVKIRGYRIELGEVESAIQQQASIKQVVVIARANEGDQKQLLAYVVTEENYDKSRLLEALKNQLPDYMIPAAIIRLDQFPLNTNGKIDRKKLPHPNASESATTDYVAPSTSTEEYLAGIWKELLNVEKVGVHDNFFELGGHSLTAVKLANQVSKVFDIKVSLRQIFANLTIRELALLIDQSEKKQYERILLAPQMDHYPLSHAQKRLWVIHQLSKNKTTYNIPFVEGLAGNIDPLLLEQCFEQTIDRHEILRTVFKLVDGEVRQFICDRRDLPPIFYYIDLSEEDNAEEKARALVEKKVAMAFDLEKGPLLKVYLIKVEAENFILLTNFHHVISDGWSSTLFNTEIIDRYSAGINQEEYVAEPLTIQYKDYAYWQNQHLLSEESQSDKHFWLESLKGELSRVEIPEDYPRPSIKTYNGSSLSLVLSDPIATAIEKIALEKNASLYMTLLAAFKALFYRYTGLNDLIIGTVVAGREKEELANQLGFYVNMLALRTQFEKTDSFNELLEKVRESVLAAYDHQYYPFDLLVDQLGITTDPSRSPIFDIAFTLQNNSEVDEKTTEQLKDIQSNDVDGVKTSASKLDLAFFGQRTEDGLQISANYNSDIFKQESIQRILTHYENFLNEIILNPDAVLNEIDILKSERLTILEEFNQTDRKKETLPSIHAYIEQYANQIPDQKAVIIGERSLTYKELNEKANQLAHWLNANYTIEKDKLIAFMIQNSEWQVIASLAILKTGAAFLPIDPSYPTARVAYILEDAQPLLCMTIEEPSDGWSVGCDLINLPKIDAALAQQPTTNLDRLDAQDHLAYVIYTSGSTGKPKGVLNTHKGNINMVTDQVRRFGIGAEDLCLQFASVSFDASIYETFIALCSGASLVLLPKGYKDNPSRFVDYLREKRVTMATLPPAYLKGLNKNRLEGVLRILVTAGEAPNLSDSNELSKFLTYYNAYGPTEFSVCTSIYKATGRELTLPIGKPIDNTQYYILDEHLNPLPIGFWGDLYISGAGMARAYLNREELTNKAFVDHAFEPGKKMYKSGDVGKWLPSGEVVFLGRKDNMVKIRGYRVELSEIENTLLAFDAVEQALVVYDNQQQGRECLNAYLVVGDSYDEEALRVFLKSQLPAYMLPNFYTLIPEIPLTANGKTDFKALPPPTMDQSQKSYRPPQNKLEEELFEMWKEVLGFDDFGTDESFFEIGGQSIMAMMLVADIWEKYEFNLTIGDIVRNPTIEAIALQLNQVMMQEKLLVPLTTVEEGRPTIFMLPPILGTSIIFHPLAHAFEGEHINCMGIQYPGFDSGKNYAPSVEAMIDTFMSEITKLNLDTKQPLTILGYSMGGFLAYALTQQLEAKGYSCKLILVDKGAGIQKTADDQFTREANALILEQQLIEIYSNDPALENLMVREEKFRNFLKHHINLHDDYRPFGTIAADILALEAQISNKPDAMQDWRKYTQGQFYHTSLNADHFGMLHADLLPEIVETTLNFIKPEILH